MKRLIGTIASVVFAGTTSAAEIAWTAQANTGQDSDVRTDGRCLYAYTPSPSPVNVNGVQFNQWTVLYDYYTVNEDAFPVSDFGGDASFDVAITRNRKVDWVGETQAALWTGSDDYLTLLKWSWYSGAKTRTLTLKGLDEGKRYLVQVWMCDSRNSANTAKKLTLGDAVGNCWGAGFGSNFTGVFTADGETQDVVFNWAVEPNLTAFQVRCLDEAHITWTGGFTSGESDILTAGRCVYAYRGGEPLEIAGTFFEVSEPNASYFGDADSPDIVFSQALGPVHNSFVAVDPAVTDGAASYSPAYSNFLRCAHFRYWGETASERYMRRDVTLRNLVPGLRYQVQFWVFDNRNSAYATRTVVVGNGIHLAHNNGVTGGHGSMAVGSFTATSTEQTFSCFHRTAGELMLKNSVHDGFGPIQVRCLDDDYLGWKAGDTGLDGSVDTRGTPLYAFCGSRTVVAGTQFATFSNNIINNQTGDYLDFAVKGNGLPLFYNLDTTKNRFINGATVEVLPAVTNLLANGLHNTHACVQEIELRHLVPGRRYLVQVWFMDVRNSPAGKGGSLGGAAFEYDKAPLGQYVTGVFRASAETYSVPLDTGSKWVVINALQVRELDNPVDSDISWECTETAAAGASASTEGSLHCAYAPWAFTLGNGIAFAEGAYRVSDIGGNGDILFSRHFRERYDCYAADDASPLLKNGWLIHQGSSEGFSKYGDNTVTLGNLKPGHDYLVQLFFADLRDDVHLNIRTITIKDLSGRFGPTEGKFNYGTTFTGRFTAGASTKSFDMYTVSAGTAQLNAIQVRELGSSHPVRVAGADGDWTTDGAGWKIDAEEQTGTDLWSDASGKDRLAFIEGDAELDLGSDVTAGAVYSTGEIVIGDDGCEYALSVAGQICAPTATVNAVWIDPDIRKSSPGVTRLAGECPYLKFVSVTSGRVDLDGECARALEISLSESGTLGFNEVNDLSIASIEGAGTLAGPGGIALDDGGALELPAGLAYAEGFKWYLSHDSSLVLAEGSDAAALTVVIENPRSYRGKAVVSAPNEAAGKPQFVLGAGGYRAVWSDTLSAWTLEETGLKVIIR